MTADDLDLVDTGELVEALFRRSKARIIVLETPSKAGKFNDTTYHYDGGFHNAIGMCDRVKYDLLNGDTKNRAERSI